MAVVLIALTADTVEKLSVLLIGVLIVGAVFLIRSSVRLYTKIAVILVLGGLGVALVPKPGRTGPLQPDVRVHDLRL